MAQIGGGKLTKKRQRSKLEILDRYIEGSPMLENHHRTLPHSAGGERGGSVEAIIRHDDGCQGQSWAIQLRATLTHARKLFVDYELSSECGKIVGPSGASTAAPDTRFA